MSSGRIASFWTGGRACLRRIPASPWRCGGPCDRTRPRAACRSRQARRAAARSSRPTGQGRCSSALPGRRGRARSSPATGQRVRSPEPAPAREVLPVGDIGLVGVFGRRGLRVVAGGVDKAIECTGSGNMRGQSDCIAGGRCSLAATVVIRRILGRRVPFPGVRGWILGGSVMSQSIARLRPINGKLIGHI